MNGQNRPSDASRSLVWLITGCSSGFGRELVLAAAARGDRVIATARRLQDLDYCKAMTGVKVLELDVTRSQVDLDAKVQEAINLFGGLDVLVNNAGYVLSGVWEELSQEQVQAQFETNVFGPLKLTRSVLPHMRARGEGTIFFMGSISGWHGIPGGGPYSASKFALEGAAECLAKETQHFGVGVHILVLGQFRTNILDVHKKKSQLDPEKGHACYAQIKTEMAERHAATTGLQQGDPAVAADKIVDLAKTGPAVLGTPSGGLPLRVPLGTDAVQVMRSKCENTLASLTEWEEFARSTDFKDTQDVPSYPR